MSSCGSFVCNKYTGITLFCSCGKCKSCRMEKAKRVTRRIKNETEQRGTITLFVTLTYSNKFVPTIVRDDVDFFGNMHVYRGIDCKDIIKTVKFYADVDTSYIYKDMRKLRGQSDKDKFGVLVFEDVQLFIKRLRINYERLYKESLEAKFFTVGEYGSLYKRPHFHLLITIPSRLYGRMYSAIIASWKMCHWSVLRRGIEVAKDAARYVSGYLLKSPDLPPLLQGKVFGQKRSHSTFYGLPKDRFGIEKIAQMLKSRTPEYDIVINTDEGRRSVSVPIPQYVRDHYFCKYKGKRCLSPHQERIVLRFPEIFLYIESKYSIDDYLDVFYDFSFGYSVYFQNFRNFINEVHSIEVTLEEAGYSSPDPFDSCSDYWISYRNITLRQSRFLALSGATLDDFVIFQQSWSRMWFYYIENNNHDGTIPLTERYDNAYCVPSYIFPRDDIMFDLSVNHGFPPPWRMVHKDYRRLENEKQFNQLVTQQNINDLCLTESAVMYNSYNI